MGLGLVVTGDDGALVRSDFREPCQAAPTS